MHQCRRPQEAVIKWSKHVTWSYPAFQWKWRSKAPVQRGWGWAASADSIMMDLQQIYLLEQVLPHPPSQVLLLLKSLSVAKICCYHSSPLALRHWTWPLLCLEASSQSWVELSHSRHVDFGSSLEGAQIVSKDARLWHCHTQSHGLVVSLGCWTRMECMSTPCKRPALFFNHIRLIWQ